jgi:urease accessory protein UreF
VFQLNSPRSRSPLPTTQISLFAIWHTCFVESSTTLTLYWLGRAALQETENAEEAEATQPATTASAEETKTAEAEQTMGNQLSEQSETVLSSLTSLSEAIPEQNADSFNATTKNVVAALNGLTVALQKAGKSEAVRKAFGTLCSA